MPVEIKQLPGESIIYATVNKPFKPDEDMPAMFAEVIRLRQAIHGTVVLILDVTSTISEPDAFSTMVAALANARHGIKASKTVGLQPPITIFVGSGSVMDLAAQAITQEQYGGVGAHLCISYDEALTLAREKLSTTA